MTRRVQLALAWGKWIALRREDHEKAMEFYKGQRPRGNWGIVVEQDEMACHYQRCQFRVRRAMRAVGAWGMVGHATFTMPGEETNATYRLAGVDFPVRADTADELAKRNFDDFNKNARTRAVRSKIAAEDKRHPLAIYEDHVAALEAEAVEAEMYSMRY